MLRRFLRWRSRRDPRIDDELRFHRDRLIEDYVAAGMARGDAERRAFLEFGNAAAIREEVRDVRGRWLDDFINDLNYALRTLRRSPIFAIVAVLSLTLGIGANAAMFAVVNAVMLDSLPVKEPDRLIQITRARSDGRPAQVSYPVFESFRDHITSITDAFVQMSRTQTIDIGDEEVRADIVSGTYFTMLGLEPAAGRLLVPADDVLSPAVPAAVISDGYWQRRFGSNPSAIGTTLTIRNRVFTIVGVTPPRFRGTITGSPPDLILPLLPMMTDVQRREAGFNFLTMLARLKPGATVDQALAEANVRYRPILEAQAAEEPSRSDREALLRQRLIAFHAPDGFNPVRDNIREPLLILMGIVALILLLASMNVTGLLLARAAARQREISIRLAIGAGRGRLVRQFLAESLVLAAMGGSIGFAVAGRVGERLFALFINGRTIDLPVRPDWRVLAFTVAISLAACIAAGLVPARQAFDRRINPALKHVRAQGHGRLGKALVVTQLAISMVLVVGATLFIGTLIRLYAVDRGFESEGLIAVQVRSVRPSTPERARVTRSALLERLNVLPGIRSASAGAMLPVGGGLWDRSVRVDGHPSQSGEPERVAFNAIAPRYFATLGTPLLAGREFSDRDTVSSPAVAIVNDSFARTFFGSGSAIGRRVTSAGVTYEIVGVVGNAKYQDLRESVLRTLYIPWTQRDDGTSYAYLLRVDTGDPGRMAPAIERTLREVDATQRVAKVSTYAEWIDGTIPNERLMAALGGLFASLALVLAGVGMFGVLAFQVAKRTNELGVRTVLGASRWSMIRLVLGDVTMMVAPGVIIGGGVALMLGRLARGLLFGLTPTDPGVFLIAVLTLVSAALVASWVPAHRASRVDPLVALRHD
jgi:putative ABC transport system permease protein